jgi:hypothetical protein
MSMTVQDYRDAVIAEAVVSVHKHETREFRKQGCLDGLEICRTLLTLEDYQKEIKARNDIEDALVSCEEKPSLEDYWKFRCATAQLEYVYERMKVAYAVPGMPLSAMAIMQYAKIVGVKK